MTIIAMLALGAVCWTFRVLFILAVPADRLPARVRASLSHLAPASMAALVAVEADAATRGGTTVSTLVVLATALALFLAVRRTGSLPLAIAVGTAVAVLLDLVVL
ncbi:branched-subunit amino acid transport protein [Marmoricola sp. OAE513]|uniref:AzlD domain-containing protein n=1 Tax=Marmoricola sp. OAE513 TaxID=2817894 RepID=UPI001AE38837